MKVDERRVRALNAQPEQSGAVVYWMQRDQRVQNNWALLYAQGVARERGVPLLVLFNLVPVFGKTTLRHADFMYRGLDEVQDELRALNIPFFLTTGWPVDTLPHFVATHQVGAVVTDFNPLRFTREWREKVAAILAVRLTEVDAHNIIPCWQASEKEEFAAYTFRPKVHKLLPEFLTEFPKVVAQLPSVVKTLPEPVDWEVLLHTVSTDRSVQPVSWLVPGARAASKLLEIFCMERLFQYVQKRNDPNEQVLSNMSPYLHFGQISAQAVALTVQRADVPGVAKKAYLEELIVRRELADNYCYYNKTHDAVAGAHAWAKTTISEHTNDVREYVYTREVFEGAQTHDPLWNAMQVQLRDEGKMHGWARMYWAKKILEWTPDAQTAVDIALYLNDRYELDGTDPNGVVGVMWSICGVHDRAWGERPIFGKIRYMNFAGAKRKFAVNEYIAKYTPTLFS